MSTQNRTVLSRRRALKTGSLAAIAAGLIGATKPAEAANAAAPITVGTVADLSALTAESLRLTQECRESHNASITAREALGEHLTPEQDLLVTTFIDDFVGTHHGDFLELLAAELARHFPGLSPAIWLTFQHIMEANYDTFGRCCVDEPAS